MRCGKVFDAKMRGNLVMNDAVDDGSGRAKQNDLELWHARMEQSKQLRPLP